MADRKTARKSEVTLWRYGAPLRYTLNPAEHAVPHLISQLASAWLEVAEEVPSATEQLSSAIRDFADHLSEQLHDAAALTEFGLAEIRVRHLNAWELDLLRRQRQHATDTHYRKAVYLLSVLRRIDQDHPGLLDGAVAARVIQQTRLSHIRRKPDADHGDDEVRRIRSAAHRVVHSAMKANERVLWIPGVDVMAALHILLSLSTGEPPEVLRSLTIEDVVVTPVEGSRSGWPQNPDWQDVVTLVRQDMVQTYAVTFTKGRSGVRHEELYDKRGQRAAHQTIGRVLILTANARSRTTDSSLWLARVAGNVRQVPWSSAGGLKRWYRLYVKGTPIAGPFKYSRLRKVSLRRELITNPARYLRDGKRHTPRTLFEHYTNSAVLRAEAGKLLIEAITDYFDIATGPTIVTPDAEDLLRSGASVQLLDPGTAAALLSGELDGPLTACRNPEDSPYAEAGHVCPVSQSGLCFTCPNAIITQEHLPALVLLDELSSPEQAADAVIWRQVWQPINQATRAILPLFPAASVSEARARTGSVPVELGIRNDQRGIHE